VAPPAVASVEQPVVVLFVHARKENQEPPADVALHEGQDFGNLQEAEQRGYAVDGDDRIFRRNNRLEDLNQLPGNSLSKRGHLCRPQAGWHVKKTLGKTREGRTIQPVCEGIGKVDCRPVFPNLLRRFLEQSQPQLAFVFLVVHRQPDLLRTGNVAVPLHAADSQVVLSQ
jgi:hypothetical protein